jgi:SAM-dependent methyltransferase
MSTPFITTDALPGSLWDAAPTGTGNGHPKALRLPRMLIEVYGEMLDELSLRADAEDQSPNDEGPQGGKTEQETRKHFSRNFSGSCARVQFVALDPKEVFKTTRDTFARMFSGSHLHLLDIPCGAGAAGATLLCLAAELREHGVLPRQPLFVSVVGGDISKPAQKLKRKLYRKLAPRLKDVGIRVAPVVLDWDVEDEERTSDLINRWVRSANHRAKVAALAVNFSGFLHNKVKDCKGQLREVLRYAKAQQATVLWIEPSTNAAIANLFPGLKQHVFPKVPKVRPQWPDIPRKGEVPTVHPIQRNGWFMARSAALHLETERPQP